MSRVPDQLAALWPALAFLLAGVPLASLLGRVGFFDACAAALTARPDRETSVLGLWLLAALTTAVLNLDTTIVLLTPLYSRLARRAGTDPLALMVVPLLLASFASSVLPVSNLTTLIAAEQLHLDFPAVTGHLALPSIVAVVVGWLAYRRRHPTTLSSELVTTPDRHALVLGGATVAGLLVGFVFGPSVGIAPWMTAAAADVVLMVATQVVPWREVPVLTALAVAAVAALVAIVVPAHALSGVLAHTRPAALVGIGIGAASAANVVNNIPALLVALAGVRRATWGMWAWLLGVNTGAVLLPVGALANVLWLRIARAEGLRVDLGTYISSTLFIALPALAAAVATLALERVVIG